MSSRGSQDTIRVWSRGNTVCVRLFGQIGDRSQRDQDIKEQLEEATRKAGIKLVLDMEQVNMITSFGMSILEKFFRQVLREGGNVRMINVSEQAYHSLELMGLTEKATIELSSGEVFVPKPMPGATNNSESK